MTLQKQLDDALERIKQLNYALGAIEDITENCPAGCCFAVKAIRLGGAAAARETAAESDALAAEVERLRAKLVHHDTCGYEECPH